MPSAFAEEVSIQLRRHRTSGVLTVPAVLAVALLWRLAFLFWTDFAIESDEAVVGLMARHIWQGREFPVFYYGQPYMGALEAYVAAPLVGLVGGKVAIKLSALLWSLLHVGAFAVLARRTLGPRAGLFASLYLAAGPLLLSLWSLKLRGGFVSLWALGTLILLVAQSQGSNGATPRGSALLGLLSGLATWLNFLAFPFIAAAGLHLLSRRQVFNRLGNFALCAAGFLAGSAPLWIWNFTNDWATFRHLFSGEPTSGLANMRVLLDRHLPMLLGAVPPWGDWPEMGFLRPSTVLLALAVAAWLALHRRDLVRAFTLSRQPTSGSELHLLVALGFLACAWFTRFGGDHEPRYATVLYAFIAPAIGASLGWMWSQERAGRVGAPAMALALSMANGASIYRHDAALPVQPLHFVRDGTLIPADLTPLYEDLKRREIDVAEVEYWLGYRLIYETDEGLVTWPGRYEPYGERFKVARNRAWLFRDGPRGRSEASALERELRALRIEPERLVSQGLIVLVPGNTGLSAREWTATSSGGTEPAGNAIDRIGQTRWTTGADQAPGQWLQLDLGRMQRLGAVSVLFDRGDEPARLAIDLSPDGQVWTRVYEGAPGRAFHAALPGSEARFVRLEQLGERRGRWWSVREVFLKEADRQQLVSE